MLLATATCFASWHAWIGCVTSCRNAAARLGGAWATIEEGRIPATVLECELLLLSGWDARYESILARRSGATVARWHSSLLQTELSAELWKIVRLIELLDEQAIAAIAASDLALVDALKREGAVWLPEVLDEHEYADVRPAPLAGTNVSLFGDAHHRKSLLAQAVAFDRARQAAGSDAWMLHLNGQTARIPELAGWLALTGVPYVDHGFLDRSAYLELVSGMSAGLAASLSESYGYVVADHLLLGVPVVTSQAVLSADAGPLRIGDACDPSEIAAGLGRALEQPQLVEHGRRTLLERAAENEQRAGEALQEIRTLAGL
jgi:hypothetical protein